MQGLWKLWMTLWCWVVLAFGVVLALLPVPALSGPGRLVFGLLNSDPARLALPDQQPMQFGLGLQGALTIGWAMTTFGMIRAAEAAGSVQGAPVWRSLTLSFLVWYVVDSVISVSTGFALNAVSNTLFIAAFLIPVLASGVLRARDAETVA